MILDATTCWEIFQSRQSRYDGLFFCWRYDNQNLL